MATLYRNTDGAYIVKNGEHCWLLTNLCGDCYFTLNEISIEGVSSDFSIFARAWNYLYPFSLIPAKRINFRNKTAYVPPSPCWIVRDVPDNWEYIVSNI